MAEARNTQWQGIELIEFPVAANTTDQKLGQQSQLNGKKVIGLMWSSRAAVGPGGSNAIGTTNAAAPNECFLKLRKGQQDYVNQLPLVVLDPDFRLGEPYWLPVPTTVDWNNSTVKFTNAAHLTAGEVLVLNVYYI